MYRGSRRRTKLRGRNYNFLENDKIDLRAKLARKKTDGNACRALRICINSLSMLEHCVRCGSPAGSLMSYNYTERAVWLDDLTSAVIPGSGYPVCAIHADRLTPPMGWTLTDRRNIVRLFAPAEVA